MKVKILILVNALLMTASAISEEKVVDVNSLESVKIPFNIKAMPNVLGNVINHKKVTLMTTDEMKKTKGTLFRNFVIDSSARVTLNIGGVKYRSIGNNPNNQPRFRLYPYDGVQVRSGDFIQIRTN